MTPGGPAAKSGSVLAEDVLVAVDPGRGAMQAHWQYEQAGNRRWIDVRGWPEDKVPALLDGEPGTSLWLRLRRGDRDVVAHVTRGAAGSALFAERPLDVALVTPDGARVAVPAELALELRGVRKALEPDLPSCPASPAALESPAGRLSGARGASAPQDLWGGCGYGVAPSGDARHAEGCSGGGGLSFQIVDGGALCCAENVRAVLGHLDAGYACRLGLSPGVDLAGAMRGLVSVPDPRVIAKRAERRVADLQAQLAATDAALADARAHLGPLLHMAALQRHAKLALALGHVRLTMQQLEHERQQLADQLDSKEARQTVRRLGHARSRARWASMPSVVSWACPRGGSAGSGSDRDSDGGEMMAEIDKARQEVLERLERVCVHMATAASLQVTRVVQKLARQVADALVECEDADQLLAAVGVDGEAPLLPEEATEADALLHQACQGDPDSASPLSAAVCRAIVGRVASRSPLHLLGERLLAAVVAQMEDFGWRVRSAHARGGGRGTEEVTCLLHTASRALVQVRHGTRHAHFQFRAAAGSEVMGCDCNGVVEAGSLLAVEAVRELEDPRGRSRRVPSDGLGQVGEWRTSAQRGRLVWTNGGSALHVLRSGGFVFLPSKDGAAAVLLEDGWVRSVPRHDAVARLMLASS